MNNPTPTLRREQLEIIQRRNRGFIDNEMAKRRPPVSLEHMENVLGYKISVSESAQYKRFYSDLTTVPSDVYERTKREFEEFLRTKHSGQGKTKVKRQTPQTGIRYVRIFQSNSMFLTFGLTLL